MRYVAAAATVATAALAQLALGSALGDTRATPLLVVAALVAWAGVRGSAEAWPATLAAPPLLASASDERAGLFLLALLPAPALASLAGRPGHRLGAVGGACAALPAGLCYAAVLALAAGGTSNLRAAAGAHAGSMAGTVAAAAVLAFVLLALRPRRRGLFE